MSFPEHIRERVLARALFRCEYCLSQQEYIMGRLQIDHIVPLAKNGSHHSNNLCAACELCNQYKWIHTEAVDPETGLLVQFFNPQEQSWYKHFAWIDHGTRISGLTPCGRATVVGLYLNNRLAVRVRQHWVAVGWHQPK